MRRLGRVSRDRGIDRLITVSLLAVVGTVTTGWWRSPIHAQPAIAPLAEQPSSKPSPKPIQEIRLPGEVRPLPGQLDSVPLVSSNSPEWIKTPGILLSTFPPDGKRTPAAHLNYPLSGEFNLFTHHFTHTPKDLQTLYLGVIVHNPNNKPVTVRIPAAAGYLLEPDAPFQSKPPLLENPSGAVFSGPGIRAVDAVLRGQRQPDFPAQLVLPPKGYALLMNHPIVTRGLARPVNGRSTLIQLKSSDRVYIASLAQFAIKTAQGRERAPTLAEWRSLLDNGSFAGPRDKAPTPPDAPGSLVYSRVAGVQSGSTWRARLTDAGQATLAIPAPGQHITYPISTLRAGRLGSGQIQAAPLLVRYPDTAYESHGNYAVLYDLSTTLVNRTAQPQTVTLTLATPLKEDTLANGQIRLRQPPLDFPYFRGTVRVRYADDSGRSQIRYWHLWHRVGQVVEPLLTLKLQPNRTRSLRIDFRYPPDSTPPQALIIHTQAN